MPSFEGIPPTEEFDRPNLINQDLLNHLSRGRKKMVAKKNGHTGKNFEPYGITHAHVHTL